MLMRWSARIVFYKKIYWLTNSITLVTCITLWLYGNADFIMINLWSKIITNAIALLFFHLFSTKQLYFFYNLSHTALELYCFAFVFDLIIWTSLTLLTLLL